MSISVMTDVWKYSMASGNDLMVLLAIADNTTDDDGTAHPPINTLSEKARISESTVKRSIKTLISLGELRIEESDGTSQLTQSDGTVITQRWANRYRVLKGKRIPKEKTGGQSRDSGTGSRATNPTRGSQLRPTNHHKQPSEATKTTKIAPPSPVKRKVRRGSRDTSSSYLSGLEGEGTEEKDQSSAGTVTPEPGPSTPSLGVDTPEKEELARGRVPMAPIGVDAILEEFGPFHAKQRRYIANEFERDPDYVLRKAEIVRAQPRDNRARALLAAIRDDWQKPVPIIKAKLAKPQRPRQAEPDPQELPLSFEERISRLATLKAEMKDV